MRLLSILLLSWFTIALYSCQKNEYLTTGGSIRYDVDTLLFDTVFTNNPTSTRAVLIYNDENKPIQISSLQLQKGANSEFYFNINGQQGYTATNIEIAAKDSAWVFLGANIDTTTSDLPFVVEDKLVATLNGTAYTLPIMAMAQNVVYIVDSVLTTQTWTTQRPYVIVNNALVAENEILTINPGVKVYVHADSRLYVQGTLVTNGTLEEPILFQGDRIDRKIYIGADFGVSGEWGGLYFFSQSKNNSINYTNFINGGASTSISGQNTIAATIQLDPDNGNSNQPKLRITNSIIKNAQGYGIVAFASSMYAENNLIVECGAENMALLQGGNYEINDCTMANYGWDFNRRDKNGVFAATNFYAISATEYAHSPLTLTMNNTIVYGTFNNELYIDKIDESPANVTLNHCLIKNTDGIKDFAVINNSLVNSDPTFEQIPSGRNYNDWDYRLKDNSPAKANGANYGVINKDLAGTDRIAPYSIGSYQ